jgi:hypothetical protein
MWRVVVAVGAMAALAWRLEAALRPAGPGALVVVIPAAVFVYALACWWLDVLSLRSAARGLWLKYAPSDRSAPSPASR